ncbi:MAG: GntR family transcriptional regulator, partial [Rhodococcus sp. (in: high G+C Gram-positive bacteria)]
MSSGDSVLQTVSVVEALVAELRNRVLDGGYQAGSALVEFDVAERYSVSRPTARAAITALVYEGLLRREANKTARVVRLTQADMDDLFRIRIPLEEQILRHLVIRREVPIAAMAAAVGQLRQVAVDAPYSEFVLPDLRFHAVMVDAFGSPRLSKVYESLRGEIHLGMVQTSMAL